MRTIRKNPLLDSKNDFLFIGKLSRVSSFHQVEGDVLLNLKGVINMKKIQLSLISMFLCLAASEISQAGNVQGKKHKNPPMIEVTYEGPNLPMEDEAHQHYKDVSIYLGPKYASNNIDPANPFDTHTFLQFEPWEKVPQGIRVTVMTSDLKKLHFPTKVCPYTDEEGKQLTEIPTKQKRKTLHSIHIKLTATKINDDYCLEGECFPTYKP